MATKRACLPCKNVDVDAFLRDRMRKGVGIKTISAELASKDRMAGMGYKRPPGPAMLEDHLKQHITKAMAPVTESMPSFEAPTPAVPENLAQGDVATVVQRKSLEALESGEMRLTATHALRAQDMLDKRAEKARDRELMLVLARVLTKESAPPSKYVGMAEGSTEVIEAEATEVS